MDDFLKQHNGSQYTDNEKDIVRGFMRKSGLSDGHIDKLLVWFDRDKMLSVFEEMAAFEGARISWEHDTNLAKNCTLKMHIGSVVTMMLPSYMLQYDVQAYHSLMEGLVGAVRFDGLKIENIDYLTEIFSTARGRMRRFNEDEKLVCFNNMSFNDQAKAVISIENLESFSTVKNIECLYSELIFVWSEYVGKRGSTERESKQIMDEIENRKWNPLFIPDGGVKLLTEWYCKKFNKQPGTFRDRWNYLRSKKLVDSQGNTKK